MNCPECGHDVPASSAFCGDCGARLLGRAGPAGGSNEAEVRSLLARANLLRVRGQWEAAAEQCAAVMRIDPQNAAAHSLLGEIYDNQGHLERAIRWYEEALELNPNSVADRGKLTRARELLEARTAARARVPRDRFSWLRVSGLAGAIICGGIILLAVIFADSPPGPTNPEPALPVAHRRSGQPSSHPRWLTTQEREIGSRVESAVRPPLRFVTFQIDPSDHSVEVGLLVDLPLYKEDRPAPAVRERLRRDGYRIAHRVGRVYPEVSQVKLWVAVRMPDTAGASEYAYLFVGSIPSRNLITHPDVATAGELHQIYPRFWWNEQIAL